MVYDSVIPSEMEELVIMLIMRIRMIAVIKSIYKTPEIPVLRVVA